jgi:sugar phosphate isomerase/epimerase
VTLEPKPRLALCWPTVEAASLRALIAAAQAGGCRGIAITPMMYLAAREAGLSDRDLRRELQLAGIDDILLDALVQPLPGLPAVADLPPAAVPFFGFTQDDFHRIADALGAGTINIAHILGRAVEQDRMVDAIGRIGDAARRRGLSVVIEFMSHSAGLRTFADALDVVRSLDAPNVAVLLDTWHFYRSGGKPAELVPAVAAHVGYLQVCDAPAAARNTVARPGEDRLLPGEGAIPIQEIVGAVLAVREDVIVGVEVFSSALRDLPPSVAAARALAATKAVLARPDEASGRAP